MLLRNQKPKSILNSKLTKKTLLIAKTYQLGCTLTDERTEEAGEIISFACSAFSFFFFFLLTSISTSDRSVVLRLASSYISLSRSCGWFTWPERILAALAERLVKSITLRSGRSLSETGPLSFALPERYGLLTVFILGGATKRRCCSLTVVDWGVISLGGA